MNYTVKELIHIMNECVDKNPDFNSSFLESLITRVENGNELSEKQERAVDNIVHGYKLEL